MAALKELPMMQSVAAVFPVASVPDTVAWYSRTLGFTADPTPDATPSFAMLHRDGVEIMVRQDPGALHKRAHAGRWNAYIRLSVGEIEPLHTEIKDKARVLRAPEKTTYNNTEFEIEDCNGYVLCFGEVA
jgi:Glyoxalase/Bleomycin resistance protein/Dioxygenase superfamily